MGLEQNPLSIEVLGELNFENLEEEIQEITDLVQREEDGRGEWISNLRVIRKLIDGKQKRKNKPWSNASDVCVPLIKKLLRRWKPTLYNLYALADPICSFDATTAQGMDKAPTAELFFDWLVKTHMRDTDEAIQYLTEYIGRDGSGYIGVTWDYRNEYDCRVVNIDNIFPQGLPPDNNAIKMGLAAQYELNLQNVKIDQMLDGAIAKIREGNRFVKISYERTVSNKPKLISYDAPHIITPAHSGNAHEADFVAVSHRFTENELRRMSADGFFREDAVQELIKSDKKTKSSQTNTGQYSSNERLQDIGVNVDDDNYYVYQIFCWMDWDSSGIKKRTVLWTAQDTNGPVVLAMFPYALSVPHWPIFRFDFERTGPGPYKSQGLGHFLQSLQEQLNKQYRAKSDAIDIQLAPVFQRRVAGGLRARNIRWGPGEVVDVAEVGDIAPIEKSTFNLHQYINSEAQIENYADTAVGSLVNDLQATGRKLERRTATEVSQVSQTSEAMTSMDSASFQSVMALVWQTVWQLWLDFGPREIYFQVTGQQTPELFKKADYDKNFQLIPNGTPGNTDRNKQLSMVMQLLEMGMNDPTGSFNIPVLLRRATQLIDSRMGDIALMPQSLRVAKQTLEHAAALINAGDLPPDVQGVLTSGATNLENNAGVGGGGAV
jgi:hypothetical protein